MIWTIVRIKLQDINVNSCIRLSIQRSFVFASNCCWYYWRVDQRVVNVVDVRCSFADFAAFRCKSGYKSKGGTQGQNSPFTPVQFTTRICALNGRKLILAKTMCHVPSSYWLSTRALHTIVDGYALHCRRCKIMYSLRCGQTAMPFGKTGGTAPGFRWRLHRWSETTSFRVVFAQCCYPYVHSRGYESGRCTFILLTS